MVPRYTRPEMDAIWAPANRYPHLVRDRGAGRRRHGADRHHSRRAPRATIREKGGAKVAAISQADIDRIDAIERETRHDVIAFLTWLAEAIGEDSRFVHLGMTSSDVLDTCLSVQLTQAADLLLADLDAVLAALKARAFEHKYTPDDRPQPRHPRRTDDVRAEAGRPLRRVRPQPRATGGGARRGRGGGDQRPGRHLRQSSIRAWRNMSRRSSGWRRSRSPPR